MAPHSKPGTARTTQLTKKIIYDYHHDKFFFTLGMPLIWITFDSILIWCPQQISSPHMCSTTSTKYTSLCTVSILNESYHSITLRSLSGIGVGRWLLNWPCCVNYNEMICSKANTATRRVVQHSQWVETHLQAFTQAFMTIIWNTNRLFVSTWKWRTIS